MAKRRPEPPDESPIAWLRRERDEAKRREQEAARQVGERRERERLALEQFTREFGDSAEARASALELLRERRDGLSEAKTDLLHALEVRWRIDRYAHLLYEHQSLSARLAGSPLPDPTPRFPRADWPTGVGTREEELAELDERYDALAAEHEGAAARLGAAGAVRPEVSGLGWGYRSDRDESGESDGPRNELESEAEAPAKAESAVSTEPSARPVSNEEKRLRKLVRAANTALIDVGVKGKTMTREDIVAYITRPSLAVALGGCTADNVDYLLKKSPVQNLGGLHRHLIEQWGL